MVYRAATGLERVAVTLALLRFLAGMSAGLTGSAAGAA